MNYSYSQWRKSYRKAWSLNVLWEKYHHMQPEISPEEMDIVENKIKETGLSLVRKKIIDMLYITFKVNGETNKIARTALSLNGALKNYRLCKLQLSKKRHKAEI